MEPYAFLDENGQPKGIAIDILQGIKKYCLDTLKTESTYKRSNSYKEFLNSFESNKIQPVKFEHWMDHAKWFPIISPEVQVNDHLELYNLFDSPGSSVIVQRKLISLPRKLFFGIYDAMHLLITFFLSAICAGVLVWYLEKGSNDGFRNKYPLGVLDGTWWALVSMSTVGYGDVVPRRTISRILSMIWIGIGIVMAAAITATVTETLAGTENMLSQKKVSVMNRSWEQRIARSYNAKEILVLNTYTEVIDAVRDGNSDSALINTDYVSWKQDEITNGNEPLSVLLNIEQTIPIGYVRYKLSKNNSERFTKCFLLFRKEIMDPPMKNYFKHIEVQTLYRPTIEEFFIKGRGIYILSTTLVLVLLAGIIFQIQRIYNNKRKVRKYSTGNFNMVEVKENSKIDVEKEILQINANIAKLAEMVGRIEKKL